MKEFIEKLNKSLNHLLNNFGEHCEEWGSDQEGECKGKSCSDCVLRHAIEIANELAEEYSHCTLCYLQSPCEYQNENAQMPMEFRERGWIPVSERLPETNGKYLVTVKNLTGFWIIESNVFVCDYQYNEFIFQGWEDNKVIAWQPLPPAWKGEQL